MRLWRLGSQKHHIFYSSAAEIRKNMKISSKKAKLLGTQNTSCLDSNRWIENFYCSNHGRLWLLIDSYSKEFQYRLAEERDWLRSDKTIDPTRRNPSVSEFTLKMSRKLC